MFHEKIKFKSQPYGLATGSAGGLGKSLCCNLIYHFDMELNLIAGEECEDGLCVKAINGITTDYDAVRIFER